MRRHGKKVVTASPCPPSVRERWASAKRSAVEHLMEAHAVSQRRACATMGFDRSSVRYRSVRPSDAEAREAMKAVAAERRRFGYRRIYVILDRQGVAMNLKKLRRLHREEGLQVRRPMVVPGGPNRRWSLDFVGDAFTDGRRSWPGAGAPRSTGITSPRASRPGTRSPRASTAACATSRWTRPCSASCARPGRRPVYGGRITTPAARTRPWETSRRPSSPPRSGWRRTPHRAQTSTQDFPQNRRKVGAQGTARAFGPCGRTGRTRTSKRSRVPSGQSRGIASASNGSGKTSDTGEASGRAAAGPGSVGGSRSATGSETLPRSRGCAGLPRPGSRRWKDRGATGPNPRPSPRSSAWPRSSSSVPVRAAKSVGARASMRVRTRWSVLVRRP